LVEKALEGKRVLVTGGTGSLGKPLVRRILSGDLGTPESVTVFSRDEGKHHQMKADWKHEKSATQEIFYHNFEERLEFRLGDVRDYDSLVPAVRNAEVIFHAAALKQVPSCEYFPYEAVKTNVDGAHNLVRAIRSNDTPVEKVIGISTDKACLDYHARVELADGTLVPISKIVRERLAALVRTWDGEKWTVSRVAGWYKNKLAGRRMRRLTFRYASSNRKGKKGLWLTEDHPVLTPDGWVRAGSLKDGDAVVTGEAAPNERQLALIVGTLMGDSSLHRVGSERARAGMRLGHSEGQREWLEIKRRALSAFRPGNIETRATEAPRTPFFSFGLPASGFLTQLHDVIYKHGRRRLVRELVERCFGPELMAAWHLDDGCNAGGLLRLATHGFKEDDVRWLADFLTERGLEANVQECRWKESVYFEIRFTKAGSESLSRLIGRFVPHSLRYKIRDDAPAYEMSAWDLGDPFAFVDEAEISDGPYVKKDVYCIDVEGTHNFVAGGVVVHNCKPVNVMGMSKAIQERVLLEGNVGQKTVDFTCVRYGNVVSSRGSVIPYFVDQIKAGGPVTLTTREMTRFLITLDQAVDTVFDSLLHSERGEILVPRLPAVLIEDVARAMIGGREIEVQEVGIRPGEKVHEIMVSEEEAARTVERRGTFRDTYYAITSILPEVSGELPAEPVLDTEYSSRDSVMPFEGTVDLLKETGYIEKVGQPA
jgi:nucleoside-diphosphate-sugar epimerase